ncbi:MAG: NAD(P)-dependent oxidoreductase [Vicinamibacteria bacterium]|nr:NAD(P)-dependent oxidoreductase [Vicinamibacteria bacterium]
MTIRRIGVAGLGIMGARMARRLLEKGFEVSVWNRTPARAEALRGAGAAVATSPRALAEGCDAVVGAVADPPAVERLLFADDGLVAGARAGFFYLETATISPALSIRSAEALRAKGADALEAPVTGSRLGAERGTLLFMTGGSEQTLAALQPVIQALGTKAIHCGDTGQASTMKLIGNAMISYMLEGFCEGLTLGRKAGLSLDTMLSVIQASGYASPYYDFKGAAIRNRDFDTHFSIDLLVKDQALALEEARNLGVPMPGLAAMREVFQAARGRGFGHEDIVAVVKVLEANAGVEA